jgi:hypothetical protein
MEAAAGHTTVIFTDQRSAGGFKALAERGTKRTAQAGVTSEILTCVEVLAVAHQEGRRPRHLDAHPQTPRNGPSR